MGVKRLASVFARRANFVRFDIIVIAGKFIRVMKTIRVMHWKGLEVFISVTSLPRAVCVNALY